MYPKLIATTSFSIKFTVAWSYVGMLFLRMLASRHLLPRLMESSRFHDGLILLQFDTIAPNLVPSVSNDLVQLSEWEQMKKGTKIRNRLV